MRFLSLSLGLVCLLSQSNALQRFEEPLIALASPSRPSSTPKAKVAHAAAMPPAQTIKSAPAGTYNTNANIAWDFGTSNKVLGVNLGGWLVLEPWMTPSLFKKAIASAGKSKGATIKDEYTLSAYYGAKQMQQILRPHWNSFYTLDDFKRIKNAGFNMVRIPIGHWAVDIAADEPYTNGQFPYLQKATLWAKSVGLKVSVDLHGAPRSQNGFDNSGISTSTPRWQDSPVNIQRTLHVISNFTAEFSKPVYGGTVVSIDVVNEPTVFGDPYRQDVLLDFYNKAYSIVHAPGNHFAFSIHDSFRGLQAWSNFMPRSSPYKDVILTIHPYTIFSYGGLAQSDSDRIASICNTDAKLAKSQQNYYDTVVSEWSPAFTDCGMWINGLGQPSHYENGSDGNPPLGSCKGLSGDASKFSAAYVARLRKYYEVQARVFSKHTSGWMTWAWKTEPGAGEEWSYEKGMQYGFVPSTSPLDFKYPDANNAAKSKKHQRRSLDRAH